MNEILIVELNAKNLHIEVITCEWNGEPYPK